MTTEIVEMTADTAALLAAAGDAGLDTAAFLDALIANGSVAVTGSVEIDEEDDGDPQGATSEPQHPAGPADAPDVVAPDAHTDETVVLTVSEDRGRWTWSCSCHPDLGVSLDYDRRPAARHVAGEHAFARGCFGERSSVVFPDTPWG